MLWYFFRFIGVSCAAKAASEKGSAGNGEIIRKEPKHHMKTKLRKRLFIGLGRISRSGLCILLSLALMLSFPVVLTAESNDGATQGDIVQYLKMPGEFSMRNYGILPAHLAENTELYLTHDQASLFYYEVDSDDCVVWRDGSWGEGLVRRTFSGRGAKIQTSYTYDGVLITDIGEYEAKIVPWAAENLFAAYMEKNASQFKSRLIYYNEADDFDTRVRVATYAGEYDNNFKSETVTTDWGVTTFSGNTFYTVKDIMVLTADFRTPSDYVKDNAIEAVTGEVTSEGVPIIWLDCGETIRPSAPDAITAEMLATLKFEVDLVPKLSQASEPTTVIFEATRFSEDYSRLGLTAIDAEALVGDEWRIVELRDISEYGEYPLHTTKGDTGTTVKSPITDMAGNPFAIDGTVKLTKRPVYIDILSATVVSAELDSNAVKSGKDLAQADMFLSVGDWVQFSLILSEQVFLLDGAEMSDICLQLELTDKSGDYIELPLDRIETVKPSANMGNVTRLVFDKITVEDGMNGTFGIRALIGAEKFEDASHNIMDGNLSGVSADKQLGLDKNGPVFEIVGDTVRQIDSDYEKYLIIRFKLTDSDVGILKEDLQQLSVSTKANVSGLTWQYRITDSADAVEFDGEGTAVNTAEQYSNFSVPASGEYFLHLYLGITAETELLDSVGIHLDFQFTDTKKNESKYSLSLTDLGIDRKKPVLTVVPHAVVVERQDNEANTTTFKADVSATDLNGIERIEYQWTDVGVAPVDNGWTVIASGETIEYILDGSVDVINKILYVRAYDNNGNACEYVSDENVFTADLSRINPRYEIVYDENKPGGIANVNVLSPVSSNAVYGGYTRVTVKIGDKTYVRVFNITDESAKAVLLDGSSDGWYLVQIENGLYSSVTAEAPDLNYYGTIEIAFAASVNDLTPLVGGSAVGEGDTSFQDGNAFDIIYTCQRNDVHSVILGGVTDGSGIALYLESNGTHSFYRVYQSLVGVRYNFTLANVLMNELGVEDVDFDGSYAQFVVLDAQGNRTDAFVGERIPLFRGTAQSISVPQSEYSSRSGAYGIVIYIAQESGGVQEFFLNEKLLLDNDPIPDSYGVAGYERAVEYKYFTNDDSLLGLGVSAGDGEYITSVNIGVTRPTEHYNGTDRLPHTVIYKDGKPAFIQTVTNSLGNTNGWEPSGKTVTLAIPTVGESYLGEAVGEIRGIRIWNSASSGDPYGLPWDSSIRNTDGAAEYSLYLELGWYSAEESMVVSPEMLAETDVSEFKLALGRNVICYQFIMANGKVSPESRFEINLFDEAPSVEMSMSFDNPLTMVDYLRDDYTYPIEGTEYERVVAQSVYFNIDYAYSPNGALTVYHAYVDPETNEWVINTVDGGQPIPMKSDSTNGYIGLDGTNSSFTQYGTEAVSEIILIVDEAGNATAFYPIVSSAYSGDKYEGGSYVFRTYYFEKNSSVGSLWVEAGEADGIVQSLIFESYELEKKFNQISIQIDGGKEVKLNTQGDNYDIFANANGAGLLGSKYGEVFYVFKYDPSVAEGENITHTITVRGYAGGEQSVDADGNIAETTLTVTAPNVKPRLTLSGDRSIGAVGVNSGTYLSLKGITEREVYGVENEWDEELGDYVYPLEYIDNYSVDFKLPIFEDGTYTYGFFDKYGEYYQLSVEVSDLPKDPVISVSETEITKDPVTVTVRSAEGGTFLVDADALGDIATVSGNGTSELVIVLTDNASFNISCTYSGSSYEIPITVSNIYSKPIEPTIVWNYNKYKVNKEDNSYEGEVTATLVDANGSYLTDARGVAPSFTFVPGGVTSFTFTDYENHVGMKGEDITAVLPVNLVLPETEESINDTFAPDVGISGYVKYNGGTFELEGGYVLTDTARPTDAQVMLNNYTERYGADKLYSTVDELIDQVVWAETLILSLDISDENQTKLFLSSDANESAPDFSTGVSSGADGASIVGRTLQIDRNGEYVLHVVDSHNNSSSIVFWVGNLGDEPPAPTLTQALIKKGEEVRIYVSEPLINGITDFKVTNTDFTVNTETDINSRFFGNLYISVTDNRTVAVHYSYSCNGQTFEGTVNTTVSSIDMTPPQVVNTVWSANYDGTGVKHTNQDVTAQMTFSRQLGDVFFCDENGNQTYTPFGVTVVFIRNRVTVIYENNAPEVYIKAVSLINSDIFNIISLPEITVIDKTPLTLEASVTLSDDHSRATVTVTSDKEVMWKNGTRGTEYTERVSSNGEYTYHVADRAGNTGEISVTVEGIVEGKLTITISSDQSGNNVIDPETYPVRVGDKLYVTVNRDASITLNGDSIGMRAEADTPVEIIITEDSAGLYPTVYAVDDYGNSAIAQLLRVPKTDRRAPTLMLDRSLISISMDMTEDETVAKILENLLAADETTPGEKLVLGVELPTVTSAGTYTVTYYAVDEAGNRGEAEGQVRFYNGEEILIMINGETVEKEQYVIVESGEVTITLSHNGELYKLDMREGNKSLGQMKYNTTSLTDGYTDAKENEITLELNQGYHTFLVTTQGRDMYRFVIYVMG